MQGTDTMVKQTLRFIEENPADITFTRRTKVPDGAGGYTTTDAPLPDPQQVRVVQQPANAQVERRNQAGEVVRPALNIIALPDANIEIADTFTWQGRLVEVVWITDLGYELICEVALR